MKKTGWMVAAVALSLSVAVWASSIGSQPKAERPTSKSADQSKSGRTSPESKTVRGAELQASKTLAHQIAQLKQEHQAAMNELEEIKRLAGEEKATKTLSAVEKLITRRNQEFQKRIEPLQQRLDRLQGKTKGGEKSADKAKTESTKGRQGPKG